MPGFLSSRPNWVLPPPHPQASVAPPSPFGSNGGNTLVAGERVGVPNSDEGTYTLVLYVYYSIIDNGLYYHIIRTTVFKFLVNLTVMFYM